MPEASLELRSFPQRRPTTQLSQSNHPETNPPRDPIAGSPNVKASASEIGLVCALKTVAKSWACNATPGGAGGRPGGAASRGAGVSLTGGAAERVALESGRKKPRLHTSRDAELEQTLPRKKVLVAIWKTERSNSGVCSCSDWESGTFLSRGLDFGDKGTGLGAGALRAERD